MDKLQEARRRVSETKDEMDLRNAQLTEAEDAWHQACIELDRLEDALSEGAR